MWTNNDEKLDVDELVRMLIAGDTLTYDLSRDDGAADTLRQAEALLIARQFVVVKTCISGHAVITLLPQSLLSGWFLRMVGYIPGFNLPIDKR